MNCSQLVRMTYFAGCLLLTVTGNTIAAENKATAKDAAKKAVLGVLIDPESARFGKFTQVDSKNACLNVNARNSFGGYTGEKAAVLTKLGKEWVVLNLPDISHAVCVEILEQMAAKKRDEDAAKKAVLNRLKDPKTKFGDFELVDDNSACLTLESRKSSNGNTVSQEAFLHKTGGKWIVLSIEETKHSTCQEAAKYYPNKTGAEFEAIKAVLNNRNGYPPVKFGEFKQVSDNYACMSVNGSSYSDNDEVNRQAILKINFGKWEVLNGDGGKNVPCEEALENTYAEEQSKDAVRALFNERGIQTEVKYGEFKHVGDNYACLPINDNQNDGDQFKRQAILKKSDGTWVVLTIAENEHETCEEAINGTSIVQASIYKNAVTKDEWDEILSKIEEKSQLNLLDLSTGLSIESTELFRQRRNGTTKSLQSCVLGWYIMERYPVEDDRVELERQNAFTALRSVLEREGITSELFMESLANLIMAIQNNKSQPPNNTRPYL